VNKLIHGFAAAAALAGLLGFDSAAQAASKTCRTGLVPTFCTTGWIRANPRTHHVHVSVSSWQTWSVHDIDSRVRVGHGTNGIWGTEKTITGLYGRYNASISNQLSSSIVGGHITIRND